MLSLLLFSGPFILTFTVVEGRDLYNIDPAAIAGILLGGYVCSVFLVVGYALWALTETK